MKRGEILFICVTIVCMETELLKGWEIVPSCK